MPAATQKNGQECHSGDLPRQQRGTGKPESTGMHQAGQTRKQG